MTKLLTFAMTFFALSISAQAIEGNINVDELSCSLTESGSQTPIQVKQVNVNASDKINYMGNSDHRVSVWLLNEGAAGSQQILGITLNSQTTNVRSTNLKGVFNSLKEGGVSLVSPGYVSLSCRLKK